MGKPARHLIGPDGEHSPNCFPCKIKTVNMAPSAMPTRNPVAARAKEKDPELAKDRDAYKRLRWNGTQPKSIQGAAQLEQQANEKYEIMTGRVETDPSIRRQTANMFAEMPKPSTTPIVRDE